MISGARLALGWAHVSRLGRKMKAAVLVMSVALCGIGTSADAATTVVQTFSGSSSALVYVPAGVDYTVSLASGPTASSAKAGTLDIPLFDATLGTLVSASVEINSFSKVLGYTRVGSSYDAPTTSYGRVNAAGSVSLVASAGGASIGATPITSQSLTGQASCDSVNRYGSYLGCRSYVSGGWAQDTSKSVIDLVSAYGIDFLTNRSNALTFMLNSSAFAQTGCTKEQMSDWNWNHCDTSAVAQSYASYSVTYTYAVAPVPLPAGAGLLVSALAVTATFRRRRARRG